MRDKTEVSKIAKHLAKATTKHKGVDDWEHEDNIVDWDHLPKPAVE